MTAFGLLSFVGLAVVVIAGIALAVARWSSHPPVSALIIIGLVFTTAPFVGSLLFAWLPMLTRNDDGGVDPLTAVLAVNAVTSFIGLAGVGLLVVAALGWRRPRPAP